MGCTCESTTKGLLEPVFLHAAAGQADQLGPHGQHGLSEGQVVHTERYHRQLGAREGRDQLFHFNINDWFSCVIYIDVSLILF